MDISKELDEIDTELKQIERQIENLLERQQFLQSRKELIQSQICSRTDECLPSSSQRKENEQVWSTRNFPWSEKVENAKENIFKLRMFRPLQLECINATMAGKDCILIMPTGGGKSLCFQLPAVISTGLTLVVSPLISLIEDQLMGLKELKIDSSFLNFNCSKEEVNAVHSAMVDKKSQLKLLYVTPEKIAKSKRFMAKLEKTFEGKMHVPYVLFIHESHQMYDNLCFIHTCIPSSMTPYAHVIGFPWGLIPRTIKGKFCGIHGI